MNDDLFNDTAVDRINAERYENALKSLLRVGTPDEMDLQRAADLIEKGLRVEEALGRSFLNTEAAELPQAYLEQITALSAMVMGDSPAESDVARFNMEARRVFPILLRDASNARAKCASLEYLDKLVAHDIDIAVSAFDNPDTRSIDQNTSAWIVMDFLRSALTPEAKNLVTFTMGTLGSPESIRVTVKRHNGRNIEDLWMEAQLKVKEHDEMVKYLIHVLDDLGVAPIGGGNTTDRLNRLMIDIRTMTDVLAKMESIVGVVPHAT